MGGACSTHGRIGENEVLVEKLDERDHSGCLSVNGRIILKIYIQELEYEGVKNIQWQFPLLTV